jgi:hypothetical protein
MHKNNTNASAVPAIDPFESEIKTPKNSIKRTRLLIFHRIFIISAPNTASGKTPPIVGKLPRIDPNRIMPALSPGSANQLTGPVTYCKAIEKTPMHVIPIKHFITNAIFLVLSNAMAASGTRGATI